MLERALRVWALEGAVGDRGCWALLVIKGVGGDGGSRR